MSLIFGLLVGIGMGVLLQRMGASDPGLIARNLRLKDFTIIKFMALTIGIGTVGIYILARLLDIPLNLDIKPTYVAGVLVGGLIFGVGFAVAGYCPGTCVVGAAEGRKDAWFTVGGGVVGALLFTVLYRAIEPVLIRPWNFGKITLADIFGVPTAVVAAALAAVILAVVILLPDQIRGGSGDGTRASR